MLRNDLLNEEKRSLKNKMKQETKLKLWFWAMAIFGFIGGVIFTLIILIPKL